MEKTQKGGYKNFICRIVIYVIGIFFLAFSVAFAVNSDLGISPVNSFPNALSLVTGVKLGTMITIVFCCYVLVQFILLGKNFKWYNVFQLAVSFVFGYFTNFAKSVLGSYCFGGPVLNRGPVSIGLGQLAMLAVSIILIAVGISLYVDVRLVAMPADALTGVLAERTGIQFHNMKIIQDCVTVAVAAAIALIFFHKLVGVGIGTVITALAVGKVIGLVQKFIRPFVNRVCGLN